MYKFGSHQTTVFKVMEVYEINTGRELREREVIRFRNQVDPGEWGCREGAPRKERENTEECGMSRVGCV